MIKHVPNILTFIRMLLSLVGMFFLFDNMIETSIIIYSVAAITDLFDGIIARKYNVTSKLGALLDQIADKVFAFSFFLGFIILNNKLVLLLFIFEIGVVLISICFRLINGTWPKSLKSGKIKTSSLFLTLVICLLYNLNSVFKIPFHILFAITIILELVAYYNYIDYLITEKKKIK